MMMPSPLAKDSSELTLSANTSSSKLTAPSNPADLESRRAQLTLNNLSHTLFPSFRLFRRSSPSPQKYDITSTSRLAASHNDCTFDLSAGLPDLRRHLKSLEDKQETVLYLAYGSNLCHETFEGRRGIKPLSAVNVVVPGLRLTFDLPGIPYVEPCFANTGLRDEKKREQDRQGVQNGGGERKMNEKSPLICRKEDGVAASGGPYHKDAWKKGLVGVVYELTPSDFAHVIATEGGGSSYHDILIPCYPLSSDPSEPVPWHPSTPSLLAHTLFAPAEVPPPPPHEPPPITTASLSRPDPSYAQPSARYLKLITDGASEHSLPTEYRAFLSSIRPYTTSTSKQRLGAFIFTSLWHPVILFLFGLNAVFGDNKTGRNPEWIMKLMAAIFAAVWASYDSFFERLFGDGERTIEDGGWEGEKGREKDRQDVLKRAKGAGLIRDDPPSQREYGSVTRGSSGEERVWDEKRAWVEEV